MPEELLWIYWANAVLLINHEIDSGGLQIFHERHETKIYEVAKY